MVSTATTLTTGHFARNDDVYVVCTDNDGDDNGNSVTSSTLTIVNTAPTITDCALSPAGPATTDDLTVLVLGWSDADGDSDVTTFSWYVNGGLDASVTGDTYSSANTTSNTHTTTTPRRPRQRPQRKKRRRQSIRSSG